MFSIRYKHQYLPLPVYEVLAIRVNTTKSTYTFTSVCSLRKCSTFTNNSTEMQTNCFDIFTVDTFNIGTVFLQTICKILYLIKMF